MDKQKTPVLAKSAPAGGNYSEPKEKTFNAATMAALQETSDIMDGKKKSNGIVFNLMKQKRKRKKN